MKPIKLILLFLFISIFGFSQEKVKFLYSGRVDVANTEYPKLSGPASSVEFNFSGKKVSINLKNIPFQGYYNYVSVELDGEYIGRYKVDNNEFKAFTFEVKNKSKKIRNTYLLIY